VSGEPEVSGAFTVRGWAFMQEALRDADRYFAGEPWVMGDAGVAQAGDRARIVGELAARYRAEYVARWRAFVAALRVAPPGALRAASAQLGVIAGGQSPLLGAVALAARHAAVGDSGVARALQPARAVVPTPDRPVGEASQPWTAALLALQGAVEQVANLPAPSDTPSTIALRDAAQQALVGPVAQAKVAARQLAQQQFATDTAALPVGGAVQALLLAPIDGAEAALREVLGVRPPRVAGAGGAGGGGPAAPLTPAEVAALNARGKALCAAMAPVLAKYPFAPEASAEASLDEVKRLLAPGTGELWAFHQDRMDGLLVRQGARWVQAPEARVGLSKSFVEFFNRAAQASAALFADGGPEPRLRFEARGVATSETPAVVLRVGDQVGRFVRGAPPAAFTWPAPGAREARLAAAENERFQRDKERGVDRATGDWAIFRLAARAGKWEGAGGSWKGEWKGAPGTVSVEFTFPTGAPVLRGLLGGVGCVEQVTR
jgi:type VI secretion system protein ImpL